MVTNETSGRFMQMRSARYIRASLIREMPGDYEDEEKKTNALCERALLMYIRCKLFSKSCKREREIVYAEANEIFLC